MAGRSDYTRPEIAACRSVLLEVLHLLGEYREHIVLVGGWVPPFLIQEADHPGSLDVDLALDFQKISEEAYQSFRRALETRGFRQGEQPFSFYREVPQEDGPPIVVRIDFLAGEYGGTGVGRRTQPVQDIRARKSRGCDLAFENFIEVRFEGTLPDGSRDSVTVKVATVVPFLVMKGMAMADRISEKDAWDIYYCIRHYPGGIERLIKQFDPFRESSLVHEGLGKIRSKFLTIDHVGPKWVVDFEEIRSPEDTETLRRDAFERVKYLLDLLDIEEFRG
jgi:hypothetical protein